MGRLVVVAGMAVAGLVTVLLLAAGAIGAVAVAAPAGPTSALIDELVAAGYQNGRLPDEALTVVSTRGGYRCRAAKAGLADLAWTALVATAQRDGIDVEGGWCYRTYQAQLSAWLRRRCYIPGNCDGDPYPPTATPGTSVHGWGLAIDIWGPDRRLLTCTSPAFQWLQENGPRFGWTHPQWARCGHQGAEPWHWQYTGFNLDGFTTTTGP